MTTFAEIETRCRGLQDELQQGALTREQYVEQVSQLMCQDETGRWWTIHPETGLWHYRWKDEWRPGVPPGHTPAALKEFLSLFPSSPPGEAESRVEKRSKGSGRWLVPVLAAVALVIVVGALVYWTLFAGPDEEQRGEGPDESASLLVATFTPGRPATFTPEAGTGEAAETAGQAATPPPMARPQGPDLAAFRPDWVEAMRDSFDRFDSGWSRGLGEGVTVDYREGKLRLDLQGTQRVAWSRFEPVSFVDGWVEVTVDNLTWSGQGGTFPAAGIALHVTEDYYGYVFRIDGAGRYAIGRTLLGELPPVVDWTASEYILTEGAPNHLAVLAKGPRYFFFINGWLVGPEGGVEDHSFPEGLLALWGESGGAAAAQIDFDDALLLVGR